MADSCLKDQFLFLLKLIILIGIGKRGHLLHKFGFHCDRQPNLCFLFFVQLQFKEAVDHGLLTHSFQNTLKVPLVQAVGKGEEPRGTCMGGFMRLVPIIHSHSPLAGVQAHDQTDLQRRLRNVV